MTHFEVDNPLVHFMTHKLLISEESSYIKQGDRARPGGEQSLAEPQSLTLEWGQWVY